MVSAPTFLSCAENIQRHFPELFLALGSTSFESELQEDKRLIERQMVQLLLRRQPHPAPEKPPPPRSAERRGQAPGWRSQAEELCSYRQPRLTDVFNSQRLTEVFDSRKRPKAAGGARRHAEPRLRQTRAAGRAPRRGQGETAGAATDLAEVLPRAPSPSVTVLSSDGVDSLLGPSASWTRQGTSSSWSSCPSAVARRRGLGHIAPVVTRPPPKPSPSVVRAPAMDRAARGRAA